MALLKRKAPDKKTRKTREELNIEGRERKRQKKHSGNQSGSRSKGNEQHSKSSINKNESDPRLGSKKPVPLIVSPSSQAMTLKQPNIEEMKNTMLTPEDELAMLENDERLDLFLERIEQGVTLTSEEQCYVDTQLDRIDELMETLGITYSDEDEKLEDIMQLLKGK